MRLREQLVRKHVHKWKLISSGWNLETERLELVRECEDCGKRMYALTTLEVLRDVIKQLPDSLAPYADVEWNEQQEV